MPTVSHWRIVVSGFGVAGSVLGAVIAAFTVASVVVTFGVWPEDPASVTLPAYTLDPPAESSRQRSEPAFVLPATTPAAATTSPQPSARAATGSPAPRRAARSTASGATRGAFASGAPDPSEEQVRPGRPAVPAPPPEEDGLGQIGAAVEDTTAALAHALRSVTRTLGEQLDPVSPVLGGTVAGLGVALGSAVDDVGRALAALLGHSPQEPTGVQRPGPSR